MNSNLLKIVFLTILGLGAITYITAPEQKQEAVDSASLNLAQFPQQLSVVGKEQPVALGEVFKKDMKNLVMVVNHDSIAVLKDFKKYAKIEDVNPILVANISGAPWFIKKWVIPGKMIELNKDSQMTMIYDEDGMMQYLLDVKSTENTYFAAYLVDIDGSVKKVYEGDVKADALNGSMNDTEIEELINNFLATIEI
jgi:hypothetical protein